MLQRFLNWSGIKFSKKSTVMSSTKQVQGYYTCTTLIIAHIGSMLHPDDIISLSQVNKHCKSGARYSNVSILIPLEYGFPKRSNIDVYFASLNDIFMCGDANHIFKQRQWMNSFDVYITFNKLPLDEVTLGTGYITRHNISKSKIYIRLLRHIEFIFDVMPLGQVRYIYIFFNSDIYLNFNILSLNQHIEKIVQQRVTEKDVVWFGTV